MGEQEVVSVCRAGERVVRTSDLSGPTTRTFTVVAKHIGGEVVAVWGGDGDGLLDFAGESYTCQLKALELNGVSWGEAIAGMPAPRFALLTPVDGRWVLAGVAPNEETAISIADWQGELGNITLIGKLVDE